jgi:membrane associated rhomboid family serine protease
VRSAPSLTLFPRFPATGGTILLAIGVTFAWWGNVDISPLFADAEIRHGEWWRLLTSTLPHAGFLHLAFNVYWIWVFGTLVEEAYGHLRTLAIFMLLAAGSSAAEFAFLQGGVGLSGVGYGLFGLLWALGRRGGRFWGAVDRSTVNLFVIWFFVCIILTVTGAMPVANIAHGSGALLGVLLGETVRNSRQPHRRAAMGALLTAVFALCLLGATAARPLVNLSRDGGLQEAFLGYEALVAGRNEEAARWLREATRYRSCEADWWYNLGIACERLGQTDEATDAFHRAQMSATDVR